MTFTLLPPKYSEEERMAKELSKAIHKSTESNNGKDRLELPITIENYRVIWNAKKEHTGTTLLLIGIFTAFLAWVMGDKELEKRMKKRREQMLMDYPEIMNKFTLLVNAGMTIKQAWYKIAEDYSTKLLQRDRDKRYAYEEMLLTANELKLGLSENMAYEQYGRRIGLIPYIKFGSLITQNLKKGNKGFTELLMQEAVEAFEERKEIAKRLGEEAGTKLLIPMMIMLILVFMIILIPAFWAFQI